ncbi:PKD domain-containing protein [candidate division WOR-3 bacterium]|nr:PKD domain-containing protein [candidate division WOR-3 bacterium]
MPEGGTRLAVAVYPFDYDPQTTRVTYCRSYEFDINYVRSSLALALTVDRHSYAPGEAVRVRPEFRNAGDDQNVTVAASLVNAATGETVKKLPVRTLAARSDTSSTTLELPTRGIPNGDYFADVTLSDDKGNVLDRGQAAFRLGIPAGEQSGFQVEPQHFRIGDAVKFSLGFANTGSTTLSGQAVFEVRLRDSVVADLRHDFKDLAPGKSRQFSDSWKSDSAKENTLYSVVGYVNYEATATPAEEIIISTNAMPSAEFTVAPDTLKAGQEIAFDAGGSKDPDGTVARYQWEFGDGAEAEGVNVSHVYPEAGEFVVTLMVTDDGGRTASTERKLVVNE